MTNTTSTASTNLDTQIEEIADKYDVSVPRLKTVFFRGVDEFVAGGIDYGSPTMYGLARVARFVQGDYGLDSDLRETVSDQTLDYGLEISEDAVFTISDVVYASGERIADMFHPGVVQSIEVDEHTLSVAGEIGSNTWRYVLDFNSGAYNFEVQ